MRVFVIRVYRQNLRRLAGVLEDAETGACHDLRVDSGIVEVMRGLGNDHAGGFVAQYAFEARQVIGLSSGC